MSESWIDIIIRILVGIGIISIILAIQTIIGYIIKRKLSKRKKLPQTALNGIFYIIRMIFGFVILIVALSYFGIIDSSATLNLTTILSTAIGFSSTIAIGNLVAGIYMIVSKPYHVGDYILIGDIEGFVDEIGLNYTSIRDATRNIFIRIPNKVAMGEDLLVYKLLVDKEDEKNKNTKKIKEKIKNLSLTKNELIKYILPIETELDVDSNYFLNTLDEVFIKWRDKFGYKPTILVANLGTMIVKCKIIISADNMVLIQDLLEQFLDDIWYSLYGEVKAK